MSLLIAFGENSFCILCCKRFRAKVKLVQLEFIYHYEGLNQTCNHFNTILHINLCYFCTTFYLSIYSCPTKKDFLSANT